MKGFINKRDKIKWEDGPFQPEFSEEKIAGMIGDSEVIADAVADAVEAEAETILEPGSDFASGVASIGFGVVAQSDLGDLADVDTTDEHNDSILVFNPITGGQTNKWNAIDPEYNRAWYHLDTVTADGTSATVRIPLLDTQGMGEPNYQRQLYIFVACELAQGANDASFGVVFEFNETPAVRRSVGDITNGISASGKRYMNARYQADGPRFGSSAKMWHGTLSNPSAVSTGQAAVYERIDGYYTTSRDVAVIELRTTTSGEVIPDGSKFDVYIYAEKFQV